MTAQTNLEEHLRTHYLSYLQNNKQLHFLRCEVDRGATVKHQWECAGPFIQDADSLLAKARRQRFFTGSKSSASAGTFY